MTVEERQKQLSKLTTMIGTSNDVTAFTNRLSPRRCVEIIDENQLTLLHVAAYYGNQTFAIKIMNVNRHSIYCKANGNFKVAKNLIAREGTTPLQLAALRGHVSIIEGILSANLKGESRIRLDVDSPDQQGMQSMHYAALQAKNISIHVLMVLIHSKAVSLDPQDNNGDTPLHLLARCLRKSFEDQCEKDDNEIDRIADRQIQCFKILVANSASLNIKNKNGKTPLTIFNSPQQKARIMKVLKTIHAKQSRMKMDQVQKEVNGYKDLLQVIQGKEVPIKNTTHVDLAQKFSNTVANKIGMDLNKLINTMCVDLKANPSEAQNILNDNNQHQKLFDRSKSALTKCWELDPTNFIKILQKSLKDIGRMDIYEQLVQ